MAKRQERGRSGVEAFVIALAAAGVPIAMAPGAYAPFGPLKAIVLSLAAALAALAVIRNGPVSAGDDRAGIAVRVCGWCALALAALLVLSTVMSPLPLRALVGAYPEYQGLASMLAALTVGALTARSAPESRRSAFRAFSVSAGIVILYAMAQRLGWDPVALRSSLDTDRVWSMLGNPANLGVWTLFAMGIGLSQWRSDPKRGWRLAGAGVAASSAVVMGWTGTRAAALGALAALVWMGVAAARGGAPERAGAWRQTAAGVAAIALGVFSAPDLGSRVLASAGRAAATASWRLELWETVPGIVADRPLLGWGPSSFAYAWQGHAGGLVDGASVASPHNILLEVLAIAGPLALMAFVGLFGALLVSLATTRAWRDGASAPLAASVAGVLVAMQFQPLSLETLALLGVVSGVLFAHVSDARCRGSEPKRSSRVAAPAPASSHTLSAPRALAVAACVLFTAYALLVAGDAVADGELDAGMSAAAAGGSWAEDVAPHLERVRSMAIAQPAMIEPGVAAAVPRIMAGDAAALEDASRWLADAERARSLFRNYWMLRGDVHLAAVAGGVGGPQEAGEAEAAYAQALDVAPGSEEARQALEEAGAANR